MAVLPGKQAQLACSSVLCSRCEYFKKELNSGVPVYQNMFAPSQFVLILKVTADTIRSRGYGGSTRRPGQVWIKMFIFITDHLAPFPVSIYLLFFSNIFFQGMTLPNFLLEEEEQERADLTRKEKIYTQSMRSQDC